MSGIDTLLGPLTTTWTPPAHCTLGFVSRASSDSIELFSGQTCSNGKMIDDVNCWPPTTTAVSSPSAPIGGWGFYSPGIACPVGYTAACTSIEGERPEFEFQYALYTGETALGCCPTGYECVNFAGHNGCHVVGNGTTAVTASCGSGGQYTTENYSFPDTTSYLTSSKGDKSSSLFTTTRVAKLFASMFQLNYKATDLPSTTTRPTDAISSPTSGAEPDSKNSSGLSKGAIAGIAVGAALGGILLLVVAFLLIRRYRRNRLSQTEVPQSTDGADPSKGSPGLSAGGNNSAYSPQPYSKVSPGYSGQETTWTAHELQATSKPVELPAGRAQD